MPNVINIARDIMAICGPLTGTRSSGSADMIASGADYNLKESTYLIPVIDGDERPDLVFKVAAGPNDDRSWTITDSPTDVTCISNVGGARHNIPNATIFNFDPPVPEIDSAVVLSGAFTGGADTTDYGGLKQALMWEHASGADQGLDLRRSEVAGYPALLVAWLQDDPADGSNVTMTYRATRAGSNNVLYRHQFQVAIVVDKSDSAHHRRHEGLYALDQVTQYLTDRRGVDGISTSSPGGIQILGRFREHGDQPVYQRFNVYYLIVGVEQTFQRCDLRVWDDWATSYIDVEKPQDPALPNQGDITVVDEMIVDMDP